ncbi:FMN-binding glutamate synthase family protein [Acetonema longum]|uniref:Ferredoxin-dependent glutamate synthase n=1 Tax=Acetonema longum DSM 6540 TaxID=1009370 RepID=F7NFV4_9FIRM|nr:FMN-binding glutamate synthase family protein [Acetonema longum]EGO65062.1 ferredoxin-dependent glutamate synthase [Acetonema longum DSM 6540]
MHIIIDDLPWLILLFILPAIGLTVAMLLAKPVLRYYLNKVSDDMLVKLLTEDYDQNLAELYTSIKRSSLLHLMEISLRSQQGKAIRRPLGSPRKFFGYDNLMFSPRQMTRISLPEEAKIDMSVTLGLNAEKPLTLNIPLLIGGMAYGAALSQEAKVALARAAKQMQTATNSGEGPYLPEERKEAGKFILQICRWPWGSRTNAQISASDMLEVQMGQGGAIGASRIEPGEMKGKAGKLAGLNSKQPLLSLPVPPGIKSPADWPAYVATLRQRAKGIPIALKIMATDYLEQDLSVALELGFDVIAIDGAEGGTHASAPAKQDDMGLASLCALIRARRFLQNSSVSLIISGGYFTPGQCLKALALGADAIYLGTVPLFALVHNQFQKVTPWEPPTRLVYYTSPAKTKLDVALATTSVANVLNSMVLEMKEAMRALGKSSLKELDKEDLVALDAWTAEITGVKPAFDKALLREYKHPI